MTNCIFYCLFFALFLNISMGSLKYSQIHRTFMSIYKGMFESCVITVDNNGDPITPYFDSAQIKFLVDNYLKDNLSKYSKDYSVSYKFLSSNNSLLCKKNCRRIKITLTAKINSFYKYDNSQTFAVADGDVL